MELDLLTSLVMSALLNIILTIYLALVWIKHKNYKGIGLFVLSMGLTTLGNIGLMLQGIAHPVFSIVVSNTLVVVGMALGYISLRLFLEYKIQLYMIISLSILVLLTIIEQSIFYFVIPDLTIRMVFISAALILPISLSAILLLKNLKNASLPGALLFISYVMQFITFLARIVINLAAPVIETNLLDTGGINSITVLIWTLSTSAWPIGIVLLIAHRLQKKAETRSKEKTTLIQELYHRTKNNMNVIISLLDLQKTSIENTKMVDFITLLQNRIYSMALVHEKLYESEDLSQINLKEYIKELFKILQDSFPDKSEDVDFIFELDDVTVLIDTAIPLGLILNELVSNSFKHAFPGDKKGQIKISLNRKKDDEITINLSDSGPGLPPGFNIDREVKKLGLQITKLLTEEQLQGTLILGAGEGFNCTLVFRDKDYSTRV